ncbi:MAG: YbjN domain-containing protein [Pseudomonadota bacterium]
MKHALKALPFLLAATQPAAADIEPIVRLDKPAAVALLLRNEGFRARLANDDRGRPEILTGVGGTIFVIKFFGCHRETDCESLLFSAGFEFDRGFPFSPINDWNAEALMGRAYLDEQCDVYLDHFALADPNQTVAQFLKELNEWSAVVSDFREHIGFDQDDPAQVASCDGDSVL